jgi:hypothetical protein
MYIRGKNNTHCPHLLFLLALLLLEIAIAQPNENTLNTIPEITSTVPSTTLNVADDNVDADIQGYPLFALYVWDRAAMNSTIQAALPRIPKVRSDFSLSEYPIIAHLQR